MFFYFYKFIYINYYLCLVKDTKLFITMCQSLGIPFIIEDTEKKVKRTGFRKSDHVQKLSVIKKLFENHYVIKELESIILYLI